MNTKIVLEPRAIVVVPRGLLLVSADEINSEHELAQGCAHDAVKHGIHCGEMLIKNKESLGHGKFMPWLKSNCQFEYSTAARYMKAARQSSMGVEVLTLSTVFGSGRSRKVPTRLMDSQDVAPNPPVVRRRSKSNPPNYVTRILRRLSKLCRDIPTNKTAIIALLDDFKNRLEATV
jgi:hypothetical protein